MRVRKIVKFSQKLDMMAHIERTLSSRKSGIPYSGNIFLVMLRDHIAIYFDKRNMIERTDLLY